MRSATTPGELSGVEAVIDKDLASELLSENLGADLFVMATDVDGVYLNWGTPGAAEAGRTYPRGSHGFQLEFRRHPWTRKWTPRSGSS